MDEKYMAAEEVLKKYGQEHLLSQYEKLSEENKSKLLDEILTLDLNWGIIQKNKSNSRLCKF